MSYTRTLHSLAAAVLALCAPLAVRAAADDFQPPRARVERAAAGQTLSPASNQAAAAVVADHLRARGASAATAASLRSIASTRGAAGVSHVRFEQEVGGLSVHGAYVKAAINARGELLQVIDASVAAADSVAPSRIDARQALAAALGKLHPALRAGAEAGRSGNVTRFARGSDFDTDPSVTAVAVPQADGSLAAGWRVETWTRKGNELHHTLVSGNGAVLAVESRTAKDSYNVFAVDPGVSPQTVVNGPAPGGVASPAGWLGSGAQSTIQIGGNNVDAYLDAVENNQPDTGGTLVANGSFLTALAAGQSPATAANRAVAVQNLFYLNNRIHDILYGHGFDEAAGNFQVDNFGRGGKASDPVQAEAQDGSGTDNANFATPPDGQKPRMQMYLWTGPGATHRVQVTAPVMRSYGGNGAAFGAPLTVTGVSGDIVPVTPANGCTAITSAVVGKVALIDRGACDFSLKVLNAQQAGATAVVVANNQGGTTYFTMGAGSGANRVRIGAMMISQNDGADLKTLLAPVGTVSQLAVQPLQKDASLDSDVVYHEYGHGLTWRMIGGMSGPLAGAIGEGASDTVAMLVNGDDVIGEYSASSPVGIRRARYAGYPLTYADVTGEEVHNDGEIYAAAMWRLIELFDGKKIPRDTLFDYFVDGMNYTPSTPAFEDMRDGMLQSAAARGAPAQHSCLIWKGFAQYGIGVGASGTVSKQGVVTITPSTTLPAGCK